MADLLDLDRADDGRLFKVRVLNTGEERIARYHHTVIGKVLLRFPCFADPERPDDYRRWLHCGWGAITVSRVRDG